jgi:hypothetical protein
LLDSKLSYGFSSFSLDSKLSYGFSSFSLDSKLKESLESKEKLLKP